MIISKRQFEAIKEFSYERIKKNDKFHQKYHIDQTVRLAVMLARKRKPIRTRPQARLRTFMLLC